MTSRIADVLIPLALDTAYSYAVPDGLSLKEGDVVQVPLGTREVVGVVWTLRAGPGGNFKPVTGAIEAPALSSKMRKFTFWACSLNAPWSGGAKWYESWRFRLSVLKSLKNTVNGGGGAPCDIVSVSFSSTRYLSATPVGAGRRPGRRP